MATWALILFDYDGCTLLVKSSTLSNGNTGQVIEGQLATITLAKVVYRVEILKISDTKAELDLFEEEWETTPQSELIDEAKAANQVGGYLEIGKSRVVDTSDLLTDDSFLEYVNTMDLDCFTTPTTASPTKTESDDIRILKERQDIIINNQTKMIEMLSHMHSLMTARFEKKKTKHTQPTSIPDPTPARQPICDATPARQPICDPTPARQPICDPTPAPQPICDPTPAPQPICDPTPAPQPICDPTPARQPICDPTPGPQPICDPTPARQPICDPTPAPQTICDPSPAPQIIIDPTPQSPQSTSDLTPEPNESSPWTSSPHPSDFDILEKALMQFGDDIELETIDMVDLHPEETTMTEPSSRRPSHNIGSNRLPVYVDRLRFQKAKQLPNARRFIISCLDLVFTDNELAVSSLEGGSVRYNGKVVEKFKLSEVKLTAVFRQAALQYNLHEDDLRTSTVIRNCINSKCRAKRMATLKTL